MAVQLHRTAIVDPKSVSPYLPVNAGDWAAVGQLLSSHGMGGFYDIILTAETIYNEDSQQRLLDCIKQVGRDMKPMQSSAFPQALPCQQVMHCLESRKPWRVIVLN